MTEAFVQKQGGWLGPIFKIYYRPMAADMGNMATVIREVALHAGAA